MKVSVIIANYLGWFFMFPVAYAIFFFHLLFVSIDLENVDDRVQTDGLEQIYHEL